MHPDEQVDAWAASGAMALTGRPDGPPLGPPHGLVPALSGVADRLARVSSRLGRPVDVDPSALLTERAALLGLSRAGTASCGGATRLLPAHDGWVAVSLARPDDVDLLPAWLGVDPGPDPWPAVASAVADRRPDEVVAAGAELGLAVAMLGELTDRDDAVVETAVAERPAIDALDDVLVIDLSSLWAGPLCGSLLADAGATVVKVESPSRPDGARRGDPTFFDLMNADKSMVALDLTAADGRARLHDLVRRADVVIEASRPRALEQLGIDATDAVRDGVHVWVSITAHGRAPGHRDRVGFGDDAAVAGGLVAWEGDEPRFCADAVADPLTGLVAATAALEALAAGGGRLLDVALARVAASMAGPTITADVAPGAVAAPVARRERGPAGELGADTSRVLGELGVSR